MQHEYTAQQLAHAMGDSYDITGDTDILEVSFEGIRAFLDALPDQPGDDALREQAGLYKELIDHPFFKDWSISGTSVRNFMMNKLDSAMTPQDDWEACEFADIRKGDRVKRVDANYGGDTTITTEGTVARLEVNYALSQGGSTLGNPDDDGDTLVQLYRIPAPVVHPDPERHPAIHVEECDIVGFIPKIMVWYRDSYVAGQQCLSPERITSWQPVDWTPQES